ncbi:hypothetical protein, partial [Komagataeibacter sp. FXV3]|uniref:hypothetical protein n=1 Tax=Komagataeibacter sp. FXV3 TaxID=2608998 RepID=UPI00187B7CAB
GRGAQSTSLSSSSVSAGILKTVHEKRPAKAVFPERFRERCLFEKGGTQKLLLLSYQEIILK